MARIALYYAYLLVTKAIQQKIRFFYHPKSKLQSPKKFFRKKVELGVRKCVEN